MDALKVPVAEVFENWGKEIQPIVGKGNYSSSFIYLSLLPTSISNS